MKKTQRFSAVILSLILVFAFSAGASANTGIKGRVTVESARKKYAKKDVRYKEHEAIVMYRPSTTITKKKVKKALNGVDGVTVKNVYSFNTPDDVKVSKKTIKTVQGSSVQVAVVRSETLTTKQLIEKLSKKKSVLKVEPNYRLHKLDLGVNDSYAKYQWGLENTGQNGGDGETSVHISHKWNSDTSSTKIIAICDTGVDYTHEDLKNSMWRNVGTGSLYPNLKGECGYDFVNGDADPMDDNGHGTHCAGIIGAEANNGVGITGVNQKPKIMALKMLDAEGDGWGGEEVACYNYISKAQDLGLDVCAINNSWGGGEESEIFNTLVDIVGKKGAVSCFAAGNSAEDNDDEDTYSYPSTMDSEYKISVGAVNEYGKPASYSCYGKTSVDTFAPGSDILSSVSYLCYNPGIYDDTENTSGGSGLNSCFTNFNEGNAGFIDVSKIGVQESDEDPVNSDGSGSSKITLSDENFGLGVNGKSLRFSAKMKEGDIVVMRIPFKVSDNSEVSPYYSMMIKSNVPEGDLFNPGGVVLVGDFKHGTDFSEIIGEGYSVGAYVDGESDTWDHVSGQSDFYKPGDDTDREFVIAVAAYTTGNFDIKFDDIGISRTDRESIKKFGKYDFYSGTSMATPHVTGAVALESNAFTKEEAPSVIESVLSKTGKSDALKEKCVSGGYLDFTKSTELSAVVTKASVDVKNDQIKISGRGLKGDFDIYLRDSFRDSEFKKADIVKKDDEKGQYVIIRNDGYINNIADIKVVKGEEENVKKNILLTKGKSLYKTYNQEAYLSDLSMTTDGRYIYMRDSASDSVNLIDTKDEDLESDTVAKISIKKIFKEQTSQTKNYDFLFEENAALSGNTLYSVVSYSEVKDAPDSYDDDDDDWSVRMKKSVYADDDEDDEEENYGSHGSTAYSSQFKLISINTKGENSYKNLGKLPKELYMREGYTLCAYNGKIYFIGGFDYSTGKLSRKVNIYDPKSKKWSKGKDLPLGRAQGKAFQWNNSIVYTLGYGEEQEGLDVKDQKAPANLVFDGSKWTKKNAELETYYRDMTVTRNGNKYVFYNANAGICKQGIAYSDNPALDVGDSYYYDVNKDRYVDSGYTQAESVREMTSYLKSDFVGTVVGGKFWLFNGEYVSTRPVSSGLLKVSSKTVKGGKIINSNKGFMPGTAVTLTAKPNKSMVVKSFKVDGKTVKGVKKSVLMNKNHTASVTFMQGVKKIVLKKKTVTVKAGGTYRIKAKVLPKKAKNKKLSYKSSNAKYASVNKKGLVSVKKAGKGKTVKIKITATDGTKTKAVLKIKIK